MSIFKREFDINELIQLSSSGLIVADFNKIRDVLITLNKKIYGNDIDMSAESPDVQYLITIALIINNILQLTQYAYLNMDPNTAEGKYLDTLCQLSNIKRKNKSQSTARLYVKNVSDTEQTPDKITFVDRNNNTWTWDNPKSFGKKNTISWIKDQIIPIDDVKCDSYGEITALGNHFDGSLDSWNWDDINNNGDIYSTIDNGIFQVLQIDDAIPGGGMESDGNLRIRRNTSLGSRSVSVLSGLKAALLGINGIKDCWIYNNISNNNELMEDGAQIALHDIYICLRYVEGVGVSRETIGKLIYNKLTPGIKTSDGNKVSIKYGSIESLEIQKTNNYKYPIYWKKCTPITGKTFTITGTIYDNFDYTGEDNTFHPATTTVENRIVNAIINYLNNIQLSEGINLTTLGSAIQRADITKNNASTYTVNPIVSENIADTKTYLSYFNVKPDNIQFKYTLSTMTMTITITI